MKFLTQAKTDKVHYPTKSQQKSGTQRGYWAEYLYVAQTFDYGDYVILKDAPKTGVLRLVGLQPPLNDGPGKAFLQTNGQVYSRSHDLFQIIACEDPSSADIDNLDNLEDLDCVDGVSEDMGYAYCEPLNSADKKYFRTRTRKRFLRRVGRGGVAAVIGLSAVTGVGAVVLGVAALVGATTIGAAGAVGGGAVLIGHNATKSRSRANLSSGSRGYIRSSSSRSLSRTHINSGRSRPRLSVSGSRRPTARVSSRPKARISSGGGSRLLGRGR